MLLPLSSFSLLSYAGTSRAVSPPPVPRCLAPIVLLLAPLPPPARSTPLSLLLRCLVSWASSEHTKHPFFFAPPTYACRATQSYAGLLLFSHGRAPLPEGHHRLSHLSPVLTGRSVHGTLARDASVTCVCCAHIAFAAFFGFLISFPPLLCSAPILRASTRRENSTSEGSHRST